MECSTVYYSKLREHPEFRIDAECYKPYHLEIEQSIIEKGFNLIQDYSISVINFGAYSLCNHIEFLDSGKPFLVVEDIGNNIIETRNLHYISDEVHQLLHKSHCQKGQVLLTMAGSLGKSAVFNEDFECSSNQAIAKITLKPNSINPYYLSTFLNCKQGKSQVDRFKTGTVQPNLNLGLIKLIKIPEASLEFQEKIDQLVNDALIRRKNSAEVYKKAKNTLLSEIGLDIWQPEHQLSFIKNYSDIKQVDRIDAEYFQPKYDEIIGTIKNYTGGWHILDDLVHIRKSVEVGSNQYTHEGVPFVRVSNISQFEISEEKYISNSLYNELAQPEGSVCFEDSKSHQPQQGEILFSKDGTPGIAHYLNEKPKKMIVSGGILRLKSKTDKINNEYLALVLNSILTQEQVNRDVGGSVIYHWRPDQIKEVVIPILPEEIQNEIQEKVMESFNLRKQSKNLLDFAKRAVEIAIEKDEKTALNWLTDKTSTIAKE